MRMRNKGQTWLSRRPFLSGPGNSVDLRVTLKVPEILHFLLQGAVEVGGGVG